MSDSVQPHRRQSTRLTRLWESPGKNIGVGCHCLLQCMKMKSESEVTQSCPTLGDPVNCSPPGSSVHRIFQARVLEWGAIGFSWKLSSVAIFMLFQGAEDATEVPSHQVPANKRASEPYSKVGRVAKDEGSRGRAG